MKKAIKRTLTLVLALIMLLCAVPTVGAVSDYLDGVSMNIDFCKAESIYYEVGILGFAKVGNDIWVMTKSIETDESGKEISSMIPVYSSDGTNVTLSVEAANGNKIIKEAVTFDKNGNILKMVYIYGDDKATTNIIVNWIVNSNGYITQRNELSKRVVGDDEFFISENNEIYSYEYDGNGRILKIIEESSRNDEDGFNSYTYTYTYEYDSYGNITKESSENWAEIRTYEYDDSGKILSIGDDMYALYSYEYDKDGNITQINRMSGSDKNPEFAYEYHDNGNLKTRIVYHSNDEINTYRYDVDGKALRCENNDGTVYTYEWAKLSDLIDIEPTDPTEPTNPTEPTEPPTEPTTQPSDDQPQQDNSFLGKIKSFFQRIIDWFRNLFKRK